MGAESRGIFTEPAPAYDSEDYRKMEAQQAANKWLTAANHEWIITWSATGGHGRPTVGWKIVGSYN